MSNINPYNVDGTFPIAGQDNSSQGFRDNFTNIKNNFIFAQNELADLQAKALTTSSLNGQTLNNNMAGTQIIAPQLVSWTQSLIDLGVASAAVQLDFTKANFQKITTGASINLSFTNWPATFGTGALGYGLMRVWIYVTSVSHTVTLPSSVSVAVGDIAGYNTNTHVITFDAVGNYVFDFSSIDGGNTYLIFDVTRNRNSLRDPQIYFNPAVTTAPTLFLGYGQNGGGIASLNLAVANDQGQNIVSAMGSYNSVAIGNLSFANVTNATLDTGKIGGYTITAARGNLATSTFTPVQSNDYMGYINSIAYTGNGQGGATGNAFQQTASMVFYATGTNQVSGLGGNIALYASPGAESGTNQLVQVASIETAGNLGMFRTMGGIANGGTYVTNFVTSGGSIFTANNAINTLIIDSTGSASIASGIIILPSNPVDRQTFKIVAVAPIATANVYSTSAIKYVASNKFASGNAVAFLTYISSVNTWYLS
jgi:hypothetical protein